MQKNIGKRTQMSKKIQVNCKWKLIGICNNPQALVPNQKLLCNVKHDNKYVTGSRTRRGSTDTPKLGKNCRGLKSASPNEVVPVVTNEKNVIKPTVENEMHKSRQLLDAFDILDSNSELFVKLLRDPNSLLMKRIRSQKDLQEETAMKSGTSSTAMKSQKPEHTVRKSLLEMIRSQDECPSKDNEIICTSNSVTVLKPNHKEHGRHGLAKHKNLRLSNTAQIASTSERPIDNVQSITVSCSNRRDLEAKRRLCKRLNIVEKSESLSGKEAPRTLRRILQSSPDHDFKAFCPKLETELQMRSSSTSTFQLFTEDNSLQHKNKGILAMLNCMRPDEALEILGSEAKNLDTVSATDDLSSEACEKNMKLNDMIQPVSVNLSEMPSKENNVHFTNAEKSTNTTKTRKQYQFMECSTQDLHFEHQTLISSTEVSSSNPMGKYKVELEDSFDDTEENLSPVSVLVSLFSEDVTSPSSKINQNQLAKPQSQPVHINFEEESVAVDHKINICSCIRTILQASELNWKELSENSRSSGQLLNLFSVDKRDLFADFLNDILLEVSQHDVECIIWSSFIRPETQAFSVLGKDVVEAVMKEVHWYLVPSVLPRKLENLVEKDMEKPQCWSGARRDTEDIVIQIVDDVLDESIMETIFAIEE